MTRAEAWCIWIASLLVAGTGIVYGVMRYALTPADPLAVVNHPWQPQVQHLHVLLAPTLVFAVGLIWRRHVWAGLKARGRAFRSGLTLALTAFPMVVSGYLLQVAIDDAWRKRWIGVHLVTSGLWVVGLLAHRIAAPWRRALPLVLLALAGLAAPAGDSAAAPAPMDQTPVTVERSFALMGTTLLVQVTADSRAAGIAASEAGIRACEAAVERLSTWGGTSELARFLAAPAGQAIALSPALYAELTGACAFTRATGGAFDPGIGALIAAWDLRGTGRRPTVEELARARASSGILRLELAGGRAIRPVGLVIDEGGFGKGAALDDAARAVLAAGARQARFDLGGQWLVAGAGDSVTIELADPRARARPVASVRIAAGSLSTSGQSERGVTVDGERIGHVLDPRTGQPARDFGSLTVWATTAFAADCLSTGLYVLGPDSALAWAARTPEIEVVVIETRPPGLIVRSSAGIAHRIACIAPDARVDAPGASD